MSVHSSLSDADAALIPSLTLDMDENKYFPTQVFTFALDPEPASALNDDLLTKIRAEREQDRAGIQRSNFRSLGGWHSQNTLHKKESFTQLVTLIEAGGETLSQCNGYHPGYKLKISTMWAITNPHGSYNKAHVHPNCVWSGVYYVQAPEGAGDIEFTDPRTENVMAPLKYAPNRQRPAPCWTKVTFTPKAGKLLIFPSWLYHAVTPNLTSAQGNSAERIIVSFNLQQIQQPDRKRDKVDALEMSQAILD